MNKFGLFLRFGFAKYLLFLLVFQPEQVFAKTVRYELNVTNASINLSGKKTVDFALLVNNGIPAPTLEFNEGDDAEVLVRNQLAGEEASIHWHGLLLPPEEDGVPYLNTPPIYAGQSRLFKFKLRQHGTYWYHSHTHLQEQKGVYGAIVIHPKTPTIKVDREAVLVVSDWSDEDADQILRNLRKDGDYYQSKKKTQRSILGAIKAKQLGTYFTNEWQRMGGMDLSDVGYDAFLINGKREIALSAKAGERIRLRVVNASASSYFYLSIGGSEMKVISADGADIEPVLAREVLIATAETYDILFQVPENKTYELRATAQDVTGSASAWIGSADKNSQKIKATDKPQPDLYAPMEHSLHAEHGSHGTGDTHSENHHAIASLTVDSLKALSSTVLPASAHVTDLQLVLDGSMERYVWHINGKTIQQEQNIFVKEGDVIRFTFVNKTMMHHPLHLHGHFFRVITPAGARSPLKHTVDVPPHGTRTIEFYANEPGQWILHCHNLYHMKTGMGRVVNYLGYKPRPEVAEHQKHDPHRHEHLYTYGKLESATNRGRGQYKVVRTWDELDLQVESKSATKRSLTVDDADEWDFEGELLYRRWFSNFFNVMAGGTIYHEEGFALAGVGYELPLLVHSQLFLNHEGKIRLDLGKKFQWTDSLSTGAEFKWRPDGEGDEEIEFEVSLMYGPGWHWAAGLMLTENSLGFGGQFQF